MMMLVFFIFYLGFIFYMCGFYMVFSVFILFLFMFFLIYGYLFGCLDLGLIDYFFYMDFLGFVMVILTIWCFSVVYLVGGLTGGYFSFFIYYFMFMSLLFSFISSSLYMYYLFFEFSMLPIFFLILSSGSGQDRMISSYYMMVYTLLSSLPSLFIFMGLISMYGFSGFMLYSLFNYAIIDFYVIFILIMFMVKVPLFFFHIWLPKAHVDAPVEGSMILASIMLKLGGYGIFRMLLMFNIDFYLLGFIYCLGLLGILVLGCFSLFIVDIKVLVAYSSVIHMCMMVCGVLSGTLIGWSGALLMMISHGVCSSCMFMMANMIYLRSGSRCMFYGKGLFSLLPVFSYFWLSIIMFNIGAPPSLSLFSEIYCLVGLFNVDFICVFFLILGMFFVSCSMFNLYNNLNLSWGGGVFSGLFIVDYFMIVFHIYPLIFLVYFLCLV